METKICIKCGEDKPIEDFYKQKGKKDGRRGECKKCSLKASEASRRRYKESHIEESRVQSKNYYNSHKEQKLEYSRKYRKENEEKYKQYNKDYYLKNKEKHRKQTKENFQNNKDKYYERRRQRQKENPSSVIADRLRNRIYQVVRGIGKFGGLYDLIGCDLDFLKKHIESLFVEGMTWGNYGIGGWHIDHIIPCCNFDLTKREEQLKCFNYKNLQPLWEYENLSKNRKLGWEREM